LAEQDAQLQKQAYSLLQQRSYMTGLGGLILLISFAGGLIILRIRARNKIAIKQAIIQEQKRGINAVLEATEAERQHIARDLHDSLAQQLAALKIGIGRYRDQLPEDNNPLDSLLELASSSAEEARTISHRLIPKTLMSLGLTAAIRELLQKSLTPAGFQFFMEADDSTYKNKTAVAIYRVVQELVNNTLKHSGGDFVVCRLKQTDDQLLLIFEDNGRGFQPGMIETGLGMINMRTRLQAVDGQIQFLQNEDGGMRAEIRASILVEQHN
jgi:signal transduction histidine kinase